MASGGHTWGHLVWSLITLPLAPPHPRRSQNLSVTSAAPPQGGATCDDADGRCQWTGGNFTPDTCSLGAVTRQPGTPGQARVRGQEQHKQLSRAETEQATQGTEGQEGPKHPAPQPPNAAGRVGCGLGTSHLPAAQESW